jgi:predicted phosphodiesterase
MDQHKFVTFGCWNCRHEKCKIGSIIPMDKVVDKIKENYPLDGTGNSPLDYVIVSGDNYYPLKVDKKNQIVNRNDLRNGIAKLSEISPTSKPPIYMIRGNHDLEPNKKYMFEPDQLTDECYILKEETAAVESSLKIKYVQQESFTFGTDTLIILIDTSMYDEDISTLISCYPEGSTPESIREQQLKFVLDKLENLKVKNVIIIGHHPIMTVKQKDAVQKISVMQPFVDLWSALPTNKTYYYLCADLHLYQEGTVTLTNGLKIYQYVSGTGGAEKDIPPPDGIYKADTDSDLTYEIKKSQNTYGFLECTELNGDLSFVFKALDEGAVAVKLIGSILNKGGKSRKQRRKSIKQKRRISNKIPKHRTVRR